MKASLKGSSDRQVQPKDYKEAVVYLTPKAPLICWLQNLVPLNLSNSLMRTIRPS